MSRSAAPVPEEELVARATQLIPLLQANAGRADETRRVPVESIEALAEAGLFRIRLPRRLGGYEGSLRLHVDAVSEVARGCGSTGWLAWIFNANDWIVCGCFPEEVQREVYEDDPDTRVGGLFEIRGAEMRSVDGGIVVSGNWDWASGCHHTKWTLATVPLPPTGSEQGLALIPMRELTIEDSWFVSGMRGTGSETLIAKEVFVPSERLAPWSAAITRGPRQGGVEAIYGEAFVPAASLMITPAVLGVARAALDQTLERLGRGKKIAYSVFEDSRQAPSTQRLVAQAAVLVDSAYLHVRHWAEEITGAAERGEELPLASRAGARMGMGHAMRCCREALSLLLDVQGASAFHDANVMQRLWRDLESGARHGLLNPEIAAQLYGRVLLGIEEQVTPLI